jgi:hypothetical protein
MRIGSVCVLVLVLMLILIYIWYFQFSPIDVEKINIDDIKFTHGDIILFKAFDNWFAPVFINRFTHCGIIVEFNGELKLFEVVTGMRPFLINIYPRLREYRGDVFYKPVAKPCGDLSRFIKYAMENMQYDVEVPWSFLRKLCGEDLTNWTNCAELTYLCLVAGGLVEKKKIYHHLKYICDLGGDIYHPTKLIKIERVGM